jgi:hypothetical protein
LEDRDEMSDSGSPERGRIDFARTGRARFCSAHEDQRIPYWKRVEPFRPEWQKGHRHYTSKHGHKEEDVENVVVSARDAPRLTARGGILRESTGEVCYSARQRLKFEVDALEVLLILQGLVPHGAKEWNMHKIEQAFFDKHGRLGCWTAYRIPLDVFLSLFPRTFQVFGFPGKFARSLQRSLSRIVDDGEDVMRRLALLRDGRELSAAPTPSHGGCDSDAESTLPRLDDVRAKAVYLPGTFVSRQKARASRVEQIGKTIKLPPLALR